MKTWYLFLAMAPWFAACAPGQMMSHTVEDDIYYVPGREPLVIREAETTASQLAGLPVYSNNAGYDAGNYVINHSTGNVERVNMDDLTTRALSELESADEINAVVYENSGYWIGGFKGSVQDLREAARIIAQYPEGFGYIANGQEIALNLSLDSDWNVYTADGRFWWFPSSSNVEFYTQFIMGTYPRYVWTVAWNDYRYDSWAFNAHFGWPGLRVGVGWNYPGYYDPWYYDSWYGGWGWPYYSHGHYSNWYYNHWRHDHWYYDHWRPGHYYPDYGWHRPPARPVHSYNRPGTGLRPGTAYRPTRPDTRPGTITRPGTVTRPGSVTRPGATTRPSAVTRPGTTTRPAGTMTRPAQTTTRPGTVTRPGTTTRPTPNAMPGSTTESGTTTRPAGTMTRPAQTTTRPGTATRPGTTTRPSYNNSGSRSYTPPSRSNNSESSYSPSRSGSSSRSSGTSSRSGSSGSSSRSGGSGGSSRPTRR
ncbi:MAG: hypothetical protein LBR65_08835 [Culturomica sp.]|nr:hypothetical protein [Culturomica sp.]